MFPVSSSSAIFIRYPVGKHVEFLRRYLFFKHVIIKAYIKSTTMMDETGDVDESKIPSAEECQLRVDAFVEISNTDSALAQFFLQDHDWSVERAVAAYMDGRNTSEAIFRSFADPFAYGGPGFPPAAPLDQRSIIPPRQFSILSWNIDGINEANLKNRTLAVCQLIESAEPDIVFLQEVVPETLKMIEEKFVVYKIVTDKKEGYFNLTMLRIFSIYYDSHEVVPLKDTAMDRNMIVVQAHIGQVKFALMNVHLDSTQPYMNERVGQLKECFRQIVAYPPDVTVIFGGDTNLRDKEVDMVGGIPPNVVDLWEECGSRPTAKFTWDLKLNTNVQMPSQVQPRLRFDRLYVRASEPELAAPENFCIVGVEKVPGLQCFPSDHWGIRSEFKLLNVDDFGM